MRLVYISHPYTGNEAANRAETRMMCKQILNHHRNWCLFCPLDNHKFAEDAGFPYDRFMEWDLFMISKCEIVIFCGDWEHSDGCMKEYREAKRLKKKIFFQKQ